VSIDPQQPARRAGRPYRPPTDDARPEATLPDRKVRTAWLLGTSRMLLADGAYAQRRAFLPALAEHGVVCDESRVSRWESGALAPSTAVIAAYERALDLPVFALRGAVELVRRPGEPEHGLLLDEIDHERLDDLTGSALEGRADGLAWLELAQRMDQMAGVYLRESEWRRLARGLVDEQCRSVDLGFLYRTNALTRLITIPAAQRHVVHAVGALVLDPRVTRRADALRLLGHIPGARSSTLTLRLMESPDEVVRRSAAQALAGLISDGGFDADRMAELETALVRMLRAENGHQVADLATRLPGDAIHRVQRRAQSAAVEAARTYDLVSPDLATVVARRLADAAQADLPAWDGEADPMLFSLCREALFHTHARRRRAALAVLSASPYRRALAARACGLLGHPDEVVSRQAARLLCWVGDRASLPTLVEAATRGASPLVRRAALIALGNAPGDLPEAGATAAGAAIAEPGPVADAAAYALGMHGLTDDADADGALAWWREHGARLTT